MGEEGEEEEEEAEGRDVGTMNQDRIFVLWILAGHDASQRARVHLSGLELEAIIDNLFFISLTY